MDLDYYLIARSLGLGISFPSDRKVPGWIPGLPEISGPAYRETVSHDAG